MAENTDRAFSIGQLSDKFRRLSADVSAIKSASGSGDVVTMLPKTSSPIPLRAFTGGVMTVPQDAVSDVRYTLPAAPAVVGVRGANFTIYIVNNSATTVSVDVPADRTVVISGADAIAPLTGSQWHVGIEGQRYTLTRLI